MAGAGVQQQLVGAGTHPQVLSSVADDSVKDGIEMSLLESMDSSMGMGVSKTDKSPWGIWVILNERSDSVFDRK